MTPDFADKVRQQWAQTYPDVDVTAIEINVRIGRIAATASRGVEQLLVPTGVSRAEFDVLSALRRSDRPLRASEVTSVTMQSGASTTKISDRLVKIGLVERARLDRDARVVLLNLTDAGRDLVDEVFPQRLANDQELVSVLTTAETATLGALLRKVARGRYTVDNG